MCGIFGVLVSKNTGYPSGLLKSITNELFLLSESRGKEAAGIAILNGEDLNIYKKGVIASSFIRSKHYMQFLNEAFNDSSIDKSASIIKKPITIIGHTRLATNGTQTNNENNSPIVYGNTVGIHNGIIVNDDEIWKAYSSLQRTSVVDSESLFALLDFFTKKGLSLMESTKSLFNKIQGSASIACLVSGCDDMILATNTGSLYSCRSTKDYIYIFASESYILQKLIKRLKLESLLGQCDILQIKPGQGRLINIHKLTEKGFNLNEN